MRTAKRCGAVHPLYPQVRCEEHGEHGEHFNSFFMRAWDVETTPRSANKEADR